MNAPLLGASVGRQYARNAKLPAVMVAVGVFLAWAPSPAVGQTAGDSLGVGALVEAYRTTWGEHDASAPLLIDPRLENLRIGRYTPLAGAIPPGWMLWNGLPAA